MVKNFLFAILVLFNTPCGVMADVSLERQSELRHLLKHDCGSCHGMTLKGGLGPALTVDVLENKSQQMLLVTILEGRPGTPMPPWKTLMTTEEANWLLSILLQGQTNAD